MFCLTGKSLDQFGRFRYFLDTVRMAQYMLKSCLKCRGLPVFKSGLLFDIKLQILVGMLKSSVRKGN